jgi:hypothetical protein
MSERPSEESEQDGPLSIPDESLPEDVRPSEDNPLAQPAGDDVPDDILKDTSEKRPSEDTSEDTSEDRDPEDRQADPGSSEDDQTPG